MKKAFTMLELVFVIVILGIIASIGADIIARVYDSYINSRKIDRQYTKMNIVMEQISRRLKNAVIKSFIARKSDSNNSYKLVDNIIAFEKNQIHEWIAKDQESFNGKVVGGVTVSSPGWSGFVDLYNSETNATQIKTSGSNLSYTNQIINALSYGTVDINDSAIIFNGALGFDEDGYGWDHNDFNHTKIFPITYKSDDVLIFDGSPSGSDIRISEKYILTWTAYALVLNDTNLSLYYNYRPWNSEKYTDGTRQLLLENVKNIDFIQDDGAIIGQLCTTDPVDETSIKPFCVERGIF